MDESPFFDPDLDYDVHWRYLPHWSQAGKMYFVTMRTIDSIPQALWEVWLAERRTWLLKQGISCNSVEEERAAFAAILKKGS